MRTDRLWSSPESKGKLRASVLLYSQMAYQRAFKILSRKYMIKRTLKMDKKVSQKFPK